MTLAVIGYLVLLPLLEGLPRTGANLAGAREIVDRGFLYVAARTALLGVIPGVASSTWTLAWEGLVYLVLVGIGVLGLLSPRRSRFLPLLLGGVISTYWAEMALFPDVQDSYMGLRLLSCFLAGATVYVFRERLPRSLPWALGTAGILAVVGAVGGWNAFQVVVPLAGVYLLLYLAFPTRPNVFSDLSKRLGGADFSYGAYLWEWPLQ